MFQSGEVGLCRWTFLQGAITDAMAQSFAHFIRETRPRDGVIVIDISHSITFPTALQRKWIADAVKETQARFPVTISGHAVVTNSSIARATLTAINWVASPAYPEQVFSDVNSALVWACKTSPQIDEERVRASMREAITGFDALRW